MGPAATGPGRTDRALKATGGRARIGASRAGVTQLAECLLPKQNVAGSNPVSRSTLFSTATGVPLPFARLSVDSARDVGAPRARERRVTVDPCGTNAEGRDR